MKSYPHVCPACGHVDKIMRALAMRCPDCKSRAGEPCVDMRTIRSTRKPVGYLHPARHALIREADDTRRGIVLPLVSVATG